jgi:hypothetical protein
MYCALNIGTRYKNLFAPDIGLWYKKLCILNIGAQYKSCALDIGTIHKNIVCNEYWCVGRALNISVVHCGYGAC